MSAEHGEQEQRKPTGFERLWNLDRPGMSMTVRDPDGNIGDRHNVAHFDTQNGPVTLIRVTNESEPIKLLVKFNKPTQNNIFLGITGWNIKQEGLTVAEVLVDQTSNNIRSVRMDEFLFWLPEKSLSYIKQTLASHLADLLGA